MMKFLKRYLLFCCLAHAAFGANFAYVQSASVNTTPSVAFSFGNTAGNAIVVAMIDYAGSIATSVTDSLGNTYTCTNSGGFFCFSLRIAAGSNTVTAHGMTGGYGLSIAEYSSAAPYTFSVANHGANYTVTGGSFTTGTEAMAIIFGQNPITGTALSISPGSFRTGTYITYGLWQGIFDNDVASVTSYTTTLSRGYTGPGTYWQVGFFSMTSPPPAAANPFAIVVN